MQDEILTMLACPNCLGDVKLYNGVTSGLLCERCHLVYPMDGQIPMLLIDSAVKLADDEI